MKQTVETVVAKICADKEARHIAPVCATLPEIMAHPDMQEAVKQCMRVMGVGGQYKAAINVAKQPMLVKK